MEIIMNGRDVNITVCGGSFKERELGQEVIQLCKNMLLPNHKYIHVNLSFKNLGKEQYGEILPIEVEPKSRIFDIGIQTKLPFPDFISTICHEMVHLKQYVKWEFCEDIESKHYYWKNTKVGYDVDYKNLPWEKEARKLENILKYKCFDKIKTEVK
jgi:hypothetical protein